MKFDSAWNLKWIHSDEARMKGEQFTLVNHGALVAENAKGQLTGLTIFTAKDFSQSFVERLGARRTRPEWANLRFKLYLPSSLRAQAQQLSQSLGAVEIVYTSFLSFRFSPEGLQVRHTLRVVCVDDSPVMLKFLKHNMEELEFFDVVEVVSDPLKAVETIQKVKPDLVTMDIQMPGKSGVQVLKELLQVQYYPVLMISSLALEEGSLVFEALNSGAFDYLQKPKLEDKVSFKEELLTKGLLAVSEKGTHTNIVKKVTRPAVVSTVNPGFAKELIWCLGSSTGGTQALTRIFTMLPPQIPPTLVVQHIPPIFSKAFADSLSHLCPFKVSEAAHGDLLESNHVYIAPGGKQMTIEMRQGQWFIVINDDEPVNRFKPSVDYLFSRVAKHKGLKVVGGVLTGMGRDGAQGLLELKNSGARTFAQDEETSTVFGMPRAALEAGGAENAVPLDLISHALLEKSKGTRRTG